MTWERFFDLLPWVIGSGGVATTIYLILKHFSDREDKNQSDINAIINPIEHLAPKEQLEQLKFKVDNILNKKVKKAVQNKITKIENIISNDLTIDDKIRALNSRVDFLTNKINKVLPFQTVIEDIRDSIDERWKSGNRLVDIIEIEHGVLYDHFPRIQKFRWISDRNSHPLIETWNELRKAWDSYEMDAKPHFGLGLDEKIKLLVKAIAQYKNSDGKDVLLCLVFSYMYFDDDPSKLIRDYNTSSWGTLEDGIVVSKRN